MFEPFKTSDADILANKKAGRIYVADFSRGEGKYISGVFGNEEEPYDIQLKISPKIEVRISYINDQDKISGVQISKLGGRFDRMNLSTLEFQGVLNLLQIFSELDLKSISNRSMILDSTVIYDKEKLREHLNTIVADASGLEVLEEIVAANRLLIKSQEIGGDLALEDIVEVVSQLKEVDPKLLKVILDKLNSDEKMVAVLDSLTELEIEYLSASHRQKNNKNELSNLESLLELEMNGDIVNGIKEIKKLESYVAGQPEKIFQNWIEQNLWVFGIEYIKHYDARSIALFSDADLLMESMDGFLDLIELKRPKLQYEIFSYDESHDCYYPSRNLSEVIGQCLFYLQKMDQYKHILKRNMMLKY